MFLTGVMSAVMAAVIGSSLVIIPARAMDSGAGERAAATVHLAQSCGTFGPFATIRRANEVALEASSAGYSTQVFHNGDGYYVRIC
jgi:hypothetical protein